MWRAICSICLALALGLPGAAAALTVTERVLGLLAPGSQPLAAQVPADTFLDVYTFAVSGPSVALAAVRPVPVDLDILPGVEFNAAIAYLALFTATDQPLAVDDNPADGHVVAALLPQIGVYRLAVVGQGFGLVGGLYGGLLHIQAVPEPAAAALLALGLGVLAALGRRRSLRGMS